MECEDKNVELNRTIIKYPNTNDNDFAKKIGNIFKQYRIKPKKQTVIIFTTKLWNK